MSTLFFYETNMPHFELGTLSLKDLDQHLHRLVKTERKIMDEVLNVIAEMDLRQGYIQLGFGSLFAYLVGLGYSESAAQRRITATRVLQKMNTSTRHKVAQSLKEGSINLTQLGKVNSLFDYLEKLECKGELIEINTAIPKLIEDIKGQNARNTDAAIENTIKTILPAAKQNEPQLSKKPKIKKHITGKVKLTLELSSELYKKLQKVLDIKSHSIPDRNVITLFEKLLNAEIKKFEGPKIKIKSQDTRPEAGLDVMPDAGQGEIWQVSAQSPRQDCIEQVSAHNPRQEQQLPLNSNPNSLLITATDAESGLPLKKYAAKNKRKPISIIIKRKVYQKAAYQCEYINPITGLRCPETRFLNFDHIKPLALGGTNEESNYRCLCRPCNLAEAKRMGLKIPKAIHKNH